jgi:hypothetical protein
MKLKPVKIYSASLLQERVPPRLTAHTAHDSNTTDQTIDL